jgi:predicted nucleic acid-binding protein
VPQHAAASRWWVSAMNGSELIGLLNEVTLGFIRIATNPLLTPL